MKTEENNCIKMCVENLVIQHLFTFNKEWHLHVKRWFVSVINKCIFSDLMRNFNQNGRCSLPMLISRILSPLSIGVFICSSMFCTYISCILEHSTLIESHLSNTAVLLSKFQFVSTVITRIKLRHVYEALVVSDVFCHFDLLA